MCEVIGDGLLYRGAGICPCGRHAGHGTQNALITNTACLVYMVLDRIHRGTHLHHITYEAQHNTCVWEHARSTATAIVCVTKFASRGHLIVENMCVCKDASCLIKFVVCGTRCN